jgi:arginine exporter protein ArgO
MRREGAGRADRTDIQKAAFLFGIVFALVTVLGFIPGITQDFDRLTTFDDVGAKLLGIFGVNILENIVHGLYAVAGFVAASSWAASKNYFVWGGAVYLVVWIYGLVIDDNSSANILGMNNAADWLHFVLGITMLAIGYLLSRRVAADRTAAV